MHRVLLFILGSATLVAALPSRPSAIIILADDMGYGDLAANGASDVQTPHLDALAKSGLRFTAMRANATVCSPSRAALLTGRHPDRVGVPGVIRTEARESWGWLAPEVPTLGNELKAAGYHSAVIGKWHLGLDADSHPLARGFDFFHGFLGDMMDSYTSHLRHGINYMRRDREVIQPEGHATDLFAQWACDYLRQRQQHSAGQPFLLYLAFNAPHFPIEPPSRLLQLVKQRSPQMDGKRAANVAFVEHLDEAVGRVLDCLRELGLEQQTLVAFSSDNGGSLAHGQSNLPWRGGKQDHYDGGLRVPFLVRWPAVVKPGLSDYQGQLFDLFATLLELAQRRRSAQLDAHSLLPILTGGKLPDRELYFVRREGGPPYGGRSYEALIKDGWKLMQNDPYSAMELYHLDVDPGERHNLAGKASAVQRRLQQALSRQIQRGGAVPWQRPEGRKP